MWIYRRNYPAIIPAEQTSTREQKKIFFATGSNRLPCYYSDNTRIEGVTAFPILVFPSAGPLGLEVQAQECRLMSSHKTITSAQCKQETGS